MNDNPINLNSAFQNGKALIGFLTAGDPSLEKSEEFILAMAKGGADLIEIGIPFSDPIAEGEVIQRANMRALEAGTTTDLIFEMIKSVRKKTSIPLVFLTYMNPVFVYGAKRFFENCCEVGINGIIIPDLPFEEKDEISDIARQNNVDIITLIAPTSDDRIKMLARSAEGFVYLVSSLGVTGVRSAINTDLKSIISEIRTVTNTPIAVGFGISTPDQARDIASVADGVIIGSAIVKIIEKYGVEATDKLFEYISDIKKAISSS
jgi:tryptophan synthase alpha chain